MPSRRRFLAALGTAGSAGLAGCGSLPLVGGDGGDVELRDDFPESVQADSGWRSARRDGANTACVPDAETLSEPTEQWRSPQVPIQSTVFARHLTVAGATALTGGDAALGYDVASGDLAWEQAAAMPARKAMNVAHGTTRIPAADDDQTVLRVDAATGDVESVVELPARPTRPPVPVFGGYGFYAVVPTSDGLIGFDPENPDDTWTRDVFGGVVRPPAVTPSLLAAVTDTGEVYAYTRRAHEQWRIDLDANVTTMPVVGNERVYVGTWSGVVALNKRSGRVEWRSPDDASPKLSCIALGGERLFVANDSTVAALSTATGEVAWQHDAGESTTGAPAVGGDNVYVGVDEELRAYSRSGDHQWSVDLGGTPGVTVALTENRIYTYVTDDDGRARIVALG
jgi:outer membrane protein assembly factor BamB